MEQGPDRRPWGPLIDRSQVNCKQAEVIFSFKTKGKEVRVCIEAWRQREGGWEIPQGKR